MLARTSASKVFLGVRGMAMTPQKGVCLQMQQHGPPQEVLRLVEDAEAIPDDDQLLLDILAVRATLLGGTCIYILNVHLHGTLHRPPSTPLTST